MMILQQLLVASQRLKHKNEMKNYILTLIFALTAIVGFTQSTGNKQSLFNAKNTYSLANLVAATATVDTVTDTGTGAIYSKIQNGGGYVTIQVTTTKVSGTVAGTITLYGSIDGALYSAITTEETQTAMATAALANATTTFHFRLRDSPYQYYKVGVAGGTTCVYYLSGYILKHGVDH